MANSMRRVGLDVHVRETQAAVLDQGTGELSYRRIRGRPHEVVPYLEGLERPFRAVYEAGPTGYGLARRARQRGLDVGVCAPGHVLRRRQDRIKTDRRDAERLARLLWAGELRLVLVPEPWQEELRDVVRCREDLRADLMRARHRISKLCLRRERYFHGPGRAWTRRHRDWLSGLRFPDRATQLTLSDYMHAHDVLLARRERLEAELFELALASPFASTVRNLRCLRGIDTPSAVGLCCEVLDFHRFRAKQLGSFLGLVPSEDSTGEEQRRGSITKAGSKHARRLLVEAAWHYRHPHMSPTSWRADRRAATRARSNRLASPAPPIPPLAAPSRRARQARDQGGGRGGTRAQLLPLGDRNARLMATTASRLPGRPGATTATAQHEAALVLWAATASRWWRPLLDGAPATNNGLGVASPRNPV
jgi:transposase